MYRLIQNLTIYALLVLISAACNKDDVIATDILKPEIILDGDGSGIYTVKTGDELTIAPEYKNIEGADIIWTMDGKTVCRTPQWTATWPTAGEYYVTLKVSAKGGTTSEELKIVVSDSTPPVISLRIPAEGIVIATGDYYRIEPTYRYDDSKSFKVEWYVDGKAVDSERDYTFHSDTPGDYMIKITASNADGTTTREFKITVKDGGLYSVNFPTPLFFSESTTRYTFADRPVCLQPIVRGFKSPLISWKVDGKPVNCNDAIFCFKPDTPGTYSVEVEVTESGNPSKKASGNVSVECVTASESDRRRAITGNSSMYSNKVYEYLPAPGQFIGKPEELRDATPEQANLWAQNTIAKRKFVSLGSFGGHIVVGFDHSVPVSTLSYDLLIEGNAFTSDAGMSNEAGVVWVMQDINGNGLPDDEWYQLKGSEYDEKTTIHDFCVTYFRPAASGCNVEWEDQTGKTGWIDYLSEFHDQPSYYPAWINESSYTLTGTCLPARNKQLGNGLWTNESYAWGYADNVGTDSFITTLGGQQGQFNGVKFTNAVLADGTPINLQYVDFVKVQCGILSKSGWLGELSTEVLSFIDNSMAQ